MMLVPDPSYQIPRTNVAMTGHFQPMHPYPMPSYYQPPMSMQTKSMATNHVGPSVIQMQPQPYQYQNMANTCSESNSILFSSI